MNSIIVCIANLKGGTGKTTVTLNLKNHFKPDVIIDADIHKGISKLLSLGNDDTKIKYANSKNDVLEICKKHKRVLIDCGGFDSDITSYCISQADIILTPTSDDATDQFALYEFNKAMMRASDMVSEKLTAFVFLNKVHHARKNFDVINKSISKMSNLEFLDSKINNSTKISKYSFLGKPCENLNIYKQFKSVYDEVILKHQINTKK